ncbi:MAG: EAL domain-containing protein [Desulfobacteraceae bacterium]|nr:EAL domain-containing protein [Desulfobacteraceae bacterium]
MNDKNDPMENKEPGTGLNVRYIDQEAPLAFFSFDQTPLQEVIEDLPDGYYEVNLKGDLIAFNRALCRIHGYSPETMVNMNYRDYAPAEYHEAIFSVFHEVYKTGRPVQILDYKVTRPDGSICVIHTSVHLIRDRQGNPTGFRGISRDVTEQKRSQAYEQARTRVLEGIARSIPLEETLEDILKTLKQQIPECSCMLFWATNRGLEYMAGIGISEGFEIYAPKKVSPDGGACSKSAFYRKPLVIDDIETQKTCSAHCKNLPVNNLHAVWSYPVLGREKELLGVLVLYPSSRRKPTERETRYMHSAVATAELAFFHHNATSELAYLSRHDSLTGLLNRRSFMAETERLIALCKRKRWHAAIIFMDLDRFKEINDTWGHQIGDMMLAKTASRLKNTLRRSDSIARLGGDEFAVFMPETTPEGARILAERIIKAMEKPFELNGISANPGISIGIALCLPEAETSADTLLVQADEAMYVAKREFSGWAFHEPERHKKARETANLESRLLKAVAGEELLIHYQPVKDLSTGRWSGVEALVRWRDPDYGLLNASDFLSMIESGWLIREIDRYVLPRAIAETRDWEGWVSVNVSALSLRQPDWPLFVKENLAAYSFPPERLILEITEMVLLDMEKMTDILEELSGMGVRIALQDFGAGYSSLEYLTELSIHCLKIDRGFIKGVKPVAKADALMRTMLAMGKNLEIPLLVEGVETQQDLEWLTNQGCGLAQGFLLAPPAAWKDLGL